MVSDSPAPFLSSAAPLDLLQAALEISLTGFVLLRPLYRAADPLTITDLAYEHLNPAAQRMLRLPECPAESFLTLYPHAVDTGIFAFYRDTFLAGQTGRYDVNYQADSLDNYFQLTARRAGDLLVVSFSDTAEQPRTPVEEALRESQARERAEAERQQGQWEQLFLRTPAAICVFDGPEWVYQFVNPGYQALFPSRELLGKRLGDALPELADQPLLAILHHVYDTGETYEGREVLVPLARTEGGPVEDIYFDLTFQAQRNEAGQVAGFVTYANDVTEQALARQQVQRLNEQLAATNAKLTATNDEYQVVNLALRATQHQLQELNQELEARVHFASEVTEQVRARQQVEHLNAELEARVAERTQELAQAQAETDTQRQRLHQLLTEAPALIASLRGPTHVVELANEGFRAIFGGRDLVGKPYREAVAELAGQPFFDLLDRVYRTGETYYGIDEPVTLDRTNSGQLEHIYCHYTYQATRDTQGRIDGILVFAFDVTEQVLARQEREAQQQQLREVFEQAPVAIFVLRGPEYVFEVVNPSMGEMLGRPPDQMRGQRYFDLLPDLAEQGYRELLAQVWHSGQAYVTQEQAAHLPHHRAGETGYYNFTYVPLREAEGRVTGIMCVAVDVTDQVQAREQVEHLNQELGAINGELHATNEELGESNQQLTRVNIDLDNFIYTASHDLKAPISNIEGLLFLLREDLPADVTQAPHIAPTLTRMLSAVERFKRTIEHLTEVTKLQKEHTRATVSIDLAAVVEDVLLDLGPQLRETNAQLRVEVSNFPLVRFSEKNLRSVVYNLLSNALKYRHPDRRPHIDVQAHVRPGYTILEVHDNGLGLDQTQLSRLFSLFQRFHSHVEGTGIGLYMVKRMVENAGGRIEVHSQPEGGTTFFVYLPNSAPPRA